MSNPLVVEENEALQGAIERAARLPDWNAPSLEPSGEVWDDDGVWLGDWGQWEKYD